MTTLALVAFIVLSLGYLVLVYVVLNLRNAVMHLTLAVDLLSAAQRVHLEEHHGMDGD